MPIRWRSLMGEIRGCVIGAGYFARNHLHAWKDLEGVTIAGVCDIDSRRAEAGADIVGGRAFGDAAAMLDALKPDFVDIVTTHETHRALVELAVDAGCHVICQKPLALDRDDATAMVDVCGRAGVHFMVHENFRYQAPMQAARRMIDNGRIGRPNYARIQHRHHHDIFSAQPYLRTEPQLAIMDVGVHMLDLARFFMGEVHDLYARTRRVQRELAGEDSVVISLGHDDEAATLVDISFATWMQPDPFPQTLLRIAGDEGTIEIGEGFHMRVSNSRGGENFDVSPKSPAWVRSGDGLIEQSVVAIQQHWLDCLRRDVDPATSGADNLKVLDLAWRAYEEAAA